MAGGREALGAVASAAAGLRVHSPAEALERLADPAAAEAFAPLGVTTSTLVPLDLPISARASGEVMEILPFFASASGSPTSCHTCFFDVSSSSRVTVAPNLMVSPESLDTSMTSARASLSSSSAMRHWSLES